MLLWPTELANETVPDPVFMERLPGTTSELSTYPPKLIAFPLLLRFALPLAVTLPMKFWVPVVEIFPEIKVVPLIDRLATFVIELNSERLPATVRLFPPPSTVPPVTVTVEPVRVRSPAVRMRFPV